ncbi:MAG: hypothetical protein AB1689_14225 [Thermodesulfobacteriota bacterium]
MASDSGEDGTTFARCATAYREAARRDPRRCPFGYLAGDPGSGARGCFVWFASLAELFDFLCETEVGLLQFDEAETRRIADALGRVLARTRDVQRLSRDELSNAFEGWCEILWLGTFADLCSRGGDVQTSVRIAFRRELALGDHAGPIAEEELDAFVAFLGAVSGDEAEALD